MFILHGRAEGDGASAVDQLQRRDHPSDGIAEEGCVGEADEATDECDVVTRKIRREQSEVRSHDSAAAQDEDA